jgi:hypothetical protein
MPTDIDTDSNKTKELTAIEKLELEMEKEKIAQTEATSIPSSEKNDDEWSSDIEKLKQEAGIVAG